MQGWFPGKGYGLVRRFIIIFTILAICLAVSLAAPFSSSQIVVVTGASGVFLSCYLIPIINHILLYCGWCGPRAPSLVRMIHSLLLIVCHIACWSGVGPEPPAEQDRSIQAARPVPAVRTDCPCPCRDELLVLRHWCLDNNLLLVVGHAARA